MRPIDAEKLAGLALRRSSVPHDLTISIDDIDAAPTVSCEGCGHIVVGKHTFYCPVHGEEKQPTDACTVDFEPRSGGGS